MSDTPEQRARRGIDAGLTAAGWVAQQRGETNLAAARGIPPEFFDLVIVDECHRSICALWAQVPTPMGRAA